MARLGFCALVAAVGLLQNVRGQSSATEPDLAPVTMMDTGSFHTVVIIRDMGVNVVKDWGANGKGQLGLNDTKDRGDNDGDVGDLLPAVDVGVGLQAVAVTAGLRHTAAILDDGTVRGWGYNAKGQLGIGSTRNVGDGPNEMGNNMTVTDLGDETPVSISAGGWHTCVITEDKTLKCWGYNQWGELGLGNKESRGDDAGEMGDDLPTVDLGDDAEVEQISLGDWHTCVLLTDGDVSCFGKNFAGQLGYDDTKNRGDESGEMGDNLDRVNLGGKKATMVACGEEHSCAVLEDGEVRCWGLGSSGQLGQGNRKNLGDESGEMENLVGIDLGTGRTAVEVAAGGNHTCALLDNASVKCWGENSYGELGQGDTFDRGIDPSQMGDALPAIEFPAAWSVHSLSAGYYHTCTLVDETDELGVVIESVSCWGANFKGQIGLGISETEHIGDEPDEMGENLQTANLGGDFVGEDDGDKWYKKTWFYIAVGVAGAMFCCCLICLCIRSHGDNSGRGAAPPPPPPKKVSETPSDVETAAVGDKTTKAMQSAVGRPLAGYNIRKAAPKKEETATVAGSPKEHQVAPSTGLEPAEPQSAPSSKSKTKSAAVGSRPKNDTN